MLATPMTISTLGATTDRTMVSLCHNPSRLPSLRVCELEWRPGKAGRHLQAADCPAYRKGCREIGRRSYALESAAVRLDTDEDVDADDMKKEDVIDN